MNWKWIAWVLFGAIVLRIVERFHSLLRLILSSQEALSDQIKELEEKIDSRE
jgi:hypothetical protein